MVGSSLQSRELLAKEEVASSNLVFRSSRERHMEAVISDGLHLIRNPEHIVRR